MGRKVVNGRVSTGIFGLDGKIEGGFERGSISLVAGSPGTGKSTFAIQFLIDGLSKGENVLYITFEESQEKIFKHMERFGWDLRRFEKEGKFSFLNYTPERVEKFIAEGGGDIEFYLEKRNIHRVVIDSITYFLLMSKDEYQSRKALLELISMLKRVKCSTLMTLERVPKDYKYAYAEFVADNLIFLYNKRTNGVKTRMLEVFKMRGTKHPSKLFRIKITDKGIKVYN
ncbi:MAG: ATPase domain-containing protein [Nanoarchaeota archaeon]